ncbi:MAG: hypothetical protein KatS3mg057_2680 [Herpetosiphonaceae bacterium]|nr:MAG: hypothetical protein KatS3mg057_2680 [Herpetosiphonaceae bacterium]
MTDSPDGSYDNAQAPAAWHTSAITSTSFSLDDCPGALLRFDHAYVLAQLEGSQDQAHVELSRDGGASWTRLRSYSGGGIYTTSRLAGRPQPQTAISEEWTDASWQRECLPLGSASGTVRLRFSLEVDQYVADKGWALDTLLVQPPAGLELPPGVQVTPSGSATSEDGQSITLTVVLSSPPTDTLELALSSSDSSEGVLSSSLLRFDGCNWNIPQQVVVSGVDDMLADGTVDYRVTVQVADTSDPRYGSLEPVELVLSNQDNDPAATCFYDFFESGAGQWDLGGSWGITALPDGERVMTDSPDGSYDNAQAPAAWHTSAITSTSFSLDDCPGALLRFDHAYVLAQLEGSQDQAHVELSQDGGASWTRLRSYSGGGIYTASRLVGRPQPQTAISEEWTDASWQRECLPLGSASGTVRLRFSLEVDQYVADKGWALDTLLVQPPAGLELPPGVQVTPSGSATSEDGQSITLTVVLSSPPTDTLELALSSSDSSEGVLSPSLLRFDGCNWNIPQQVVVSGVDDMLADGTVDYRVTVQVADTSDPRYGSLEPVELVLSNQDNDPAATCFYDFFESGAGQWDLGGSWGITALPDGERVMTDSPDGSYDNAQAPAAWHTSAITSTSFSLDDCPGALLRFDHAYVLAQLEGSQDQAHVELSRDGGASWTRLRSYSGGGIYTTSRLAGRPQPQTAISEEWTDASWQRECLPLGSASGTVRLRFSLEVDQYVADKGWALDTLLVQPPAGLELPPGVQVTPSGSATSEDGQSITLTVVLSSPPTDTLELALSSSDSSEGVLSSSLLRFDGCNWNTPQQVVVSGVDDMLADGTVDYRVTVQVADTSDPRYGSLEPVELVLSNQDNDPAATCFYDFFESGAGQWDLGGSWGITALPDGERVMTDSPDGSYDNAQAPAAWHTSAITSTSFSLDDCPGALLRFDHAYVLAQLEGSQDQAHVELSQDGGASWTRLRSYSGGGIYTASRLVGRPQPQTAISEEWTDASWQRECLPLGSASGTVRLRFSLEVDQYVADKGWALDTLLVQPPAGLELPPGVQVTPSGSATSEDGQSITLTVVLSSPPTDTLELALSSSDSSEGVLSSSLLRFDGCNWNTPQQVVVSGVDDMLADGTVGYRVTVQVADTSDPRYDSLEPVELVLSNQDNDPAATCFYDFFESGAGQWDLGGSWGITALPDGERVMTDSPDGSYDNAQAPAAWHTSAITSTSFSLDDCPGALLRFDHAYVLAQLEGSQDQAHVELSRDGGASWTRLRSYSGGGIYTASRLVGRPQPQTAISEEWTDVPWQRECLPLGSASGTVRLRFSLEVDQYVADKGWALDTLLVQPPAGLELPPGVQVTPSGSATSEDGQSITLTVVLSSPPTDTLELALSSSDSSEGVLSSSLLRFDGCNWNTPQQVVVSGVDDMLADGTVGYRVTVQVADTSDPRYDSLEPVELALSNQDNEGWRVYLPLLGRSSNKPDLVASVQLTPDKQSFQVGEPVLITVVVSNVGSAPVTTPFWVDLYLNPSQVPTVNRTWDQLCTLNPCYGIAWRVTSPLEPGQSITLTSTPESYAAGYTNWSGSFAAGTTDLYVYADSWDASLATGAVAEGNETNNLVALHGLSVIEASGDTQKALQHHRPQPNLTAR